MSLHPTLHSELARSRQREFLERAAAQRLLRDVTAPNRIRRTVPGAGAMVRARAALRSAAIERPAGSEQCC